MQLTKEHFEQVIAGLATKSDLGGLVTQESFEQTLTEKLAPLATKQDVREGVEELARITSAGFSHAEVRFDEIEGRLDVRERVSRVEHSLQLIAKELHITL